MTNSTALKTPLDKFTNQEDIPAPLDCNAPSQEALDEYGLWLSELDWDY